MEMERERAFFSCFIPTTKGDNDKHTTLDSTQAPYLCEYIMHLSGYLFFVTKDKTFAIFVLNRPDTTLPNRKKNLNKKCANEKNGCRDDGDKGTRPFAH